MNELMTTKWSWSYSE